MKPRLLRGLLLVAALGLFATLRAWPRAEQQAPPSIVLDERSGTIELRGLRKARAVKANEWASLLRVHPSSATAGLPPMLGTYEVTGESVRFRPRFPLVPGLSYRAVFDHGRYLERTGGRFLDVPQWRRP